MAYSVEDIAAARDRLQQLRSDLDNVSSRQTPVASKRGNVSSSLVPPDGYRKMTSGEQLAKSIGDIGDVIQSWDPWGIGTFDENWQKTKSNWKSGGGTLEQGLKTLGSFLWSLPTGMASAPFSGVEKFVAEGIFGSPTSEATDEGWIPDYDMTTDQRLASAADGAIDLIGTFLGGTGRVVKGGARLLKGAKLGEAFAGKYGKNALDIAKEAGAKYGTPEYKAASRKVTASAMGWDMLEEGSEEFLQSLLGDIRGTKDQHGLDNDSLSRALEAFGLGAAGGAIFSGGADFMRRTGERLDNIKETQVEQARQRAIEKAIAEAPDTASFGGIRESFRSDEDASYMSQRVYQELSDKRAKDEAKRRNVAGSFTAISSAPLDIQLGDIDISFEELKLGILANYDELVAQIQAKEAAENQPAGAEAETVEVKVNDVAANFGLTPDQVVQFFNLVNSEATEEEQIAWLQNIVNNKDVYVIVEKSPAFNRGPFVKRIRKILKGQKQVQINPLEMNRINGDFDGDALTVWYGLSYVNKLGTAGARAASGYFEGSDFESWAGISRATFWGNGRARTSKIIDEVAKKCKEHWERIATNYGIDPSLLDVEKIVKDRLEWTGYRANKVLEDADNFNKVFGRALTDIQNDIKQGLQSIIDSAAEPEIQGQQRATVWRVGQQITEAVLHLCAISEQHRAALTSAIAAATGGTEGYNFEELQNLSWQEAVDRLQNDVSITEYIKTEIDSNPEVHSNQYVSKIEPNDALQIMMFAGLFDPNINESLSKANPIFRSAGHFSMLAQGSGSVTIENQSRFWNNFFAAAVLSAIKINGFGEQAGTVAKNFVRQHVIQIMKNKLSTSKIMGGQLSLDDARKAFIEANNEVAKAYSSAMENYTTDEGIILPNIVLRSQPTEANDKNWAGLFYDTFSDSTWGELFDVADNTYANDSISATIERSIGAEDVDIISGVASSIGDGNSEELLKLLLSMRSYVKFRNIRSEEKLDNALLADPETQNLFQRSADMVKRYNDPKTSAGEKQGILRILVNDVDTLCSLFGIDVMSAMGWFSSTQLLRSNYYNALINANTKEELNNVIFSINVFANLRALFVTSEEKNQQGFFQRLTAKDATDNDKRSAYIEMLNYLMSYKEVSGVYIDIFHYAQDLFNACEASDVPIDVATSRFMKVMQELLSLENPFEKKESLPGLFSGVFEYGEDPQHPTKVRSIVIESMANKKTSIQDIGLGMRIERAGQTSSAKIYTTLEKRSEQWKEWNKPGNLTQDNIGARLNWIKTRLRYSTTRMSSSFLSLMIRDAASLPSRDRSEKVKTTDAQSLMYSAIRIANAPAFETAFDQLAYNVTDTAHMITEVAANPVLRARILEDPTIEIPVCTEKGIPGSVSGKQVWSYLLGREFTKDSPEYSDYNDLFTMRPVLLDSLLDQTIVGVKSGDMSTAQFVVSKNDDFLAAGRFSEQMEKDTSFAENQDVAAVYNITARALLSNKKFLSAFMYYLGEDILSIKDTKTFNREVNDAFTEFVKYVSYIVSTINSSQEQFSIYDLVFGPNANSKSEVNEFFDQIRAQVLNYEIGHFEETLGILNNALSNEEAQIVAGAQNAIQSAYRNAIAHIAVSLYNVDTGHVEDGDATATLQQAANALSNAAEKYAEESVELAIQQQGVAESIAQYDTTILDNMDAIFELPFLIDMAMPEGLNRNQGLGEALQQPLTQQEVVDAFAGNEGVVVDENVVRAVNDVSVKGTINRVLASRFNKDINTLFTICRAADSAESAVNAQPFRNIVLSHLPQSFRSSPSVVDSVARRIVGVVSDNPQINISEFTREVSRIFLEYQIRDIKPSGQMALNEQVGLAARNYVYGILDGIESVRDAYPYGLVRGIEKPAVLKRINNGRGITSAKVQLAANTLNDLLTGSDVSMRTGMEGEQYKTWFAFGCLPSVPGITTDIEGPSLDACSVAPDQINVLDLMENQDLIEAVRMGLIRVEGQDHQMTELERQALVDRYISSAQESANVDNMTMFIHDSRKCTCGACSKHAAQFAMRALYDSASYASEDMTIKARKRISFACSDILKRIGRNPRITYTRKNGEPVVRNCVYLIDTAYGPTPAPRNINLASYYGEFNNMNINYLQDAIYQQINNDPELTKGWAKLSRANFFVASMMTNFVTVTARGNDPKSPETKFTFTRDEMLSGAADQELESLGMHNILQIQQHYQTLDQVARRILFYIESLRRQCIDSEIGWNDEEFSNKSDLIRQWAVASLAHANDIRTSENVVKEEVIKAFDSLTPTPRQGEVISTFNPSLFESMFDSIIDKQPSKSVSYTKDKPYTSPIDVKAKFDGKDYVFSKVFWASVRTMKDRLRESDRNLFSTVEKIETNINSQLLANRADGYASNELKGGAVAFDIPKNGNILIYCDDSDTISNDTLERIARLNDNKIYIVGSSIGYTNVYNYLNSGIYKDACKQVGENFAIIEVDLKKVDKIRRSMYDTPTIPGAHINWARQRKDGTTKNLVTFSVLDTFIQQPFEEARSGFVGNIFGGSGDSTEMIFSNSANSIGAVWSAPIAFDVPKWMNGFVVCDQSEFADVTSRPGIIDNLWNNFVKDNKDLKNDEALYKKSFENFMGREDTSQTTIKNNQDCVAIIKKVNNGVTEYYPIIPRRKSGTLVGATIYFPEKIENENKVVLRPTTKFIKALDQGGSIKFYNANLIYKAEATAGLGNGYFMLGDAKYDLEGVQQKSALDSRLLGVWDDLVSAVTMYHLYQKHAIRKAAARNTPVSIGEALSRVLNPNALKNIGASALDPLSGTYGLNESFQAVLANNQIVQDILDRRIAFVDFNGISGAQLQRIFQQIFSNCKKLDINPAALFNFSNDTNSVTSRERFTEGWDSAIFTGLTKDDIHALFNVLDNNELFCPADSVTIRRGDPAVDQQYEVVRGGEVICEMYLPMPVEPGQIKEGDKFVRVLARRRIFWPLSLSNGMTTEGQVVSDDVQTNYARNIGMALRYGLKESSDIDDVLDWAVSQKEGIIDQWVTSWVSSEAGISDDATAGRYSDLFSADERNAFFNETTEIAALSRAVRKWQAESCIEDLASLAPLPIYGMNAEEAFNFKLGMASLIKSVDKNSYGRSIPIHFLDQAVRAVSGTTKNKSDSNTFGMSKNEYEQCVRAIAKAVSSKNPTNPFSARGKNYFVNGEARYSTCIANRETIAWFAKHTNWRTDHDVDACVEQCLKEASEQKKSFLRVTSKDSDMLRKVKAIEKRINYLMHLNGLTTDEILCLGVCSYDEMSRSDYEFYLEMTSYGDIGGTAIDYETWHDLVDRTEAALRAQQNRAIASNTRSAEVENINGKASIYYSTQRQNKDLWQTLKTATTIARANSLLTLELPVNAALDKGANYGLMLLACRLADSGIVSPYDSSNAVEVDSGIIRGAAADPQLNALLNGLREAMVNNMLPQFLDFITDPNRDVFSLDDWEREIESAMGGSSIDKAVNKTYRRIARISTAEGAFNTWRNEIFLRRLAQIAGADWANDLKTEVQTADGKTRSKFEAMLINSPAITIANMLKTTSPHYVHVLRAFNGALKGDMAQDMLISALWNYLAQKNVGLDFLFTTFACKFVRASTAFTHRVLNSIAPVSAIHYVLTDMAAKHKWGEKFKALEGFEYEAERVQMYSSLREAIMVDVAHMSMTAVAAILVCTVGGLEPPEDPDKWCNEEEWTVCGMRVKTNWWLRDIFGLTLPLAITIKSAMLGKPQLATLTKSLAGVVTSNPFLKIGDIVDAVFGEWTNNEEFESAVDLYSDYPGGSPNFLEYVWGSKKAFGLSYLGQFITPNFVKELTRTLPQYEHSYNQIFAEDLTGSDATVSPKTQRTTFEDAQIRKVTRGNAFLGLLMDILPNDTNTGYAVWEMPRQYLVDPYQYRFMDSFDIRDANGNLKSDTEIQAICFEIVSMLAETDDMDALYKQGFYLSYDTKKYVADLLSDLKVYAKNKFAATTTDTNGLDVYVLGFGDELLGKQTAKEILDGYDEFMKLMDECYQKLWSDDLNQGLVYYNRYNTTWAQDAKGNWYATGYKEGLGSIFMPALLAPTNSTVAGREGDWASISAVTGGGMYDEVGNGMRALIPKTLNDYGQKDDNGNVTYSDLYKLLWGKNGIGYSGNGGSYGYGTGRGSSYTPAPPKIYAPSVSTGRLLGPSTNYSSNRPISNVDLDSYYIRPGFETKGSRKAYKREDI